MTLIEITRRFAEEAGAFTSKRAFSQYNPLDYAWKPHLRYMERFGAAPKKAVFLGMNPGPWGMSQTGVPFGEIASVRDWMGIEEEVRQPVHMHPQRPITGFSCSRSEVSGRRLWGLMRHQWPRPEDFFKLFYVLNYCPLVFMEESGKNLTPDKLPVEERTELYRLCNRYLQLSIEALEPEYLIGVGGFAEKRLKSVFGDRYKIGKILHPSPASPAANRGWDSQATNQMKALGLWSAS